MDVHHFNKLEFSENTKNVTLKNKTSKLKSINQQMSLVQFLIIFRIFQKKYGRHLGVFFGEKSLDNFQNMAGGQPLFGNTQEIHTNLQAKVSLKYQKREVVKKKFCWGKFFKILVGGVVDSQTRSRKQPFSKTWSATIMTYNGRYQRHLHV